MHVDQAPPLPADPPLVSRHIDLGSATLSKGRYIDILLTLITTHYPEFQQVKTIDYTPGHGYCSTPGDAFYGQDDRYHEHGSTSLETRHQTTTPNVARGDLLEQRDSMARERQWQRGGGE